MTDQNTTVDEPRPREEQRPGIADHLSSKATWIRFLFMCLSAVLLWIAGIAGVFVVVVGFLWVLFTGDVNPQLKSVGRRLASYVEGIIRYLTFNSEERPFPLGGEWPSGSE